jgi:hypothetical protein
MRVRRDREASFKLRVRRGVLSGHLCEEPDRANMTIIESSKVIDKVSNSAGHE